MRQPEPPARLTLVSYDDWAALARQLVEPALAFQTPSLSEIGLPGKPSWHGDRADGLESFARVLFLDALAGCQEPVVGASTSRLLEGVAVGVGDSDARWIRAPENRHALVEAVWITLSLWVGGHRLWNALTPTTQGAVRQWLAECVDLHPTLRNNWCLFAFTIARFLSSVGAPHPDGGTVETRTLERLDELYRGEGWYSDDGPATFDFYNSFAFHFFPGVVAYLDGDDELAKQSAERLGAFLPNLDAMIGPDGSPVYFGRSMTYRCAVATPFAMAGLLGVGDAAVSGGRAAHVMDYFAAIGGIEPGAPLVPGWGANDPDVVQHYSGPGAAYWAAQTFVSLLLPREHPYWSVGAPKDSPANGYQPVPGLLISTSGSLIRLANHGSYDTNATDIQGRTDDAFYARLAYSSATLPLVGDAADNAVTVIEGANRFRRGRIAATGGGEGWAASNGWLRDLDSGAELETPAQFCTVSLGGWDIHFVALPPGTHRDTSVTITGWACAALPNSDVGGTTTGASAALTSGVSTVRLHGMLGFSAARIVRGSRPAGRWAVAELSGRSEPHIYAAASSLRRSADAPLGTTPTIAALAPLTWRLRAPGCGDRVVTRDASGFSVVGS